MSTEQTPAPADITLTQMGGQRRLKAMIGAKDFFSDDKGQTLIFRFKCCPEWNRIKITLDADDTYTVTFEKVGRAPSFKVTRGEPVSGLYCEDLKNYFTRITGLYLSF
jgi:hypothetical protein